ncbi:MAG: DUF4350 domain-containing protein [Fimbriimonadaceae bacterium]|nr:DUF4350 domain-containing protein [Fimbriimonadaceae bacterium]
MRRSLDALVLGAVLVAFVVVNLLLFSRAARLARRTEIDPVASTWRTTPAGSRAAYELLQRLGLPVARWSSSLTLPLPADCTVYVLLEPRLYVRPIEALELRRFADRGGTVVVACGPPDGPNAPGRALAAQLFLRDPLQGAADLAAADRTAWPFAGAGLAWQPGAAAAARYFTGVRRISLDPAASSLPPPAALQRAAATLLDRRRAQVLAGPPTLPLLTVSGLGRGRILWLPSAGWFANGQLARDDNARFVVNLLTAHRGDGRIYFDEFHLGSFGAESLWALLGRPPQGWLLAQLAVAAALLLWRTAVRCGPPLPEPREPAGRSASEYVRALAALYRRSGARAEVAALWRQQARAAWARQLAAPPSAPLEVLLRRSAANGAAERGAQLAALLTAPDPGDDGTLTRWAQELDSALAAGQGETA